MLNVDKRAGVRLLNLVLLLTINKIKEIGVQWVGIVRGLERFSCGVHQSNVGKVDVFVGF